MIEPNNLSKNDQLLSHKKHVYNLIYNCQLNTFFLFILFLTIPLFGYCQCDSYVKKINDRFEDKPIFETIKSIKLEAERLTFDVKLKRNLKNIVFGEYEIDIQTNGLISSFWRVNEMIFLFEDNSKFSRSTTNFEIIGVRDNDRNGNSNQTKHFICSLITSSKYLDFETLSKINNETLNQFRNKALIAIRFNTSDGQVDIDLTKEQSLYFIEIFKCFGENMSLY